MFLKVCPGYKNKVYLSIVHGYRDENGKSKQKTIKKIGYLDDLKKQYDDPISHFKNLVKEISDAQLDKLIIDNIKSKKIDNNSNPKNLGYSILKIIYNELGITELLNIEQKKLDIKYKLNDILSMLVFMRILKPGSKKNNYENMNMLFENYDFSLSVARAIQKFDKWFNGIRDKYLEGAKTFINSAKLTMCVLAGIALFALLMFKIIPTGFLPDEDRGAVFTQIQLPDGSSASRTSMVADEIEEEILKIKGVETTITLVGFNGENTAFIVSDLESWDKRKKKSESSQAILQTLNRKYYKFPDATVASFSPPAISGLGMFGGFEYQLLNKGGYSAEEFYNIAQNLILKASQNSKISNLYTQYTVNLPQLLIKVDVDKALAQGVEISEIYAALNAYFAKFYINDFNKLGRVYRVYLQGDSQYRSEISDIDKIYVKNKIGEMVPLNEVITYKDIVGPYAITRFNMYPSIAINGNSTANVSSGAAMKIMEKLSSENLPQNVGFEWSGVSFQEKQSSGEIVPILLLSFIFVYLFLVGLYESWFLPVSVILIIPVAIFGALFFQYIFDIQLVRIYKQIY